MSAAARIRAVVSDVDGTLMNDEKVLTARAGAAVRALQTQGYLFSVISARPPRALRTLASALQLGLPMAAFNGGVLLRPDFTVLQSILLPAACVRQTLDLLIARGVSPWVFAEDDWLALRDGTPEVAREYRTLKFRPTIVANFDGAVDKASMIGAVNEDTDLVAACEKELRAQLGDAATIARSHPYHLDISPKRANKGDGIASVAQAMQVPLDQVAVLGDGENDVAMFARAGFSIAMGNSDASVQARASAVTDSNNDEGFAKAIERHFLSAGGHAAAREG